MESLKKRKLGSSDIELGILTLGTWGLCAESYGRVFPEQRTATLARALELGITSFDMAPTWGRDGAAERAVAEAVGSRREEMAYITRVGWLIDEGGSPYPAFNGPQLRAQCEGSLQRLGTDRVEVLLLQHPPLGALAGDELRTTMDALVAEGKARTWGASVSTADDGRAAVVSGARVLCMPFSLLQPEAVWDLSVECKEGGVGVLARSTLLFGLLSGRWGEKKRFTPDDHRMSRWTHEALEARVKRAREVKARVSPSAPTMPVAALQFVLAHEVVTSAVIGPRTPAQVAAAMEDASHELGLSVIDMQFAYNSIA